MLLTGDVSGLFIQQISENHEVGNLSVTSNDSKLLPLTKSELEAAPAVCDTAPHLIALSNSLATVSFASLHNADESVPESVVLTLLVAGDTPVVASVILSPLGFGDKSILMELL